MLFNMFKEVILIAFFATGSILSATLLPKYTILTWDKNRDGGLIIASTVQCDSNCSWYYTNEHGMRKRVSNSTVLHLTGDSEYAEYFLLDNQRQSIEEYVLVVPHGSAGSPFEGNFLSLNVCQTGILNNVEFHFTMNISERAIATKQQCDLRWNGLPECAFGDGTCLHNESSPMDKYSVRCRLATEKENYISSIPIMIGPVNDLPLCPPAGVTMTSMPTPTTTVNTPSVTTNATTVYQSTTSSAPITVTSLTGSSPTTSIAPTVTPGTPVNHSSSVNPQETNTSAAPATTSSDHTTIIISVVIAVIAIIVLTVVVAVLIFRVYLHNKNVKDGSNPNAKTDTKSQPAGCQAGAIWNHRWTDLKSYCHCNKCEKYDV